jgi:hypothetical protein
MTLFILQTAISATFYLVFKCIENCPFNGEVIFDLEGFLLYEEREPRGVSSLSQKYR